MDANAVATVHYIGQGQPAQSLVPASVPDEGTHWHPLIPAGSWDHPSFGPFEVTMADLTAMLAAFKRGVPTSLGVPIDEKADHSFNAEGAYGWVLDLKIHDGILWGAVELTEAGRAKVNSRELPFISPRFMVGGEADGVYDAGSYIQSAALTSRPFFWQQPDLPMEVIAASAYSTRNTEEDGGDVMGKEARTKIEAFLGRTLTDEEWADMTKELPADAAQEAWDELVAGVEAAETQRKAEEDAKAAAQQQLELDAEEKPAADAAPEPPAEEDNAAEPALEPDAVKALEDRVNELAGKLEALDASRQEAIEMAASATARADALEAARKGDQGKERHKEIAATKLGANRDKTLAPSAVEVLANALNDPTEETVTALWDHIKQHGGAVLSYRPGEVAAAVPPPAAPDVAAQLDGLGVAPSTRRKLLAQHNETGKGIHVLYREHLAHVNAGGR
jgi:hypothetical protein